jgi:hypothetical protein
MTCSPFRLWATIAFFVFSTACGDSGDDAERTETGQGGGANTGGSAGSSGQEGVGGSGAEAPIETCIAPCIFELTEPCRARESCSTERVGPTTIMCEAESGYRYERDPGRLGRDIQIWMNDELCYYVSTSRDGDSERYYSPEGTLVGEIYWDSSSEIMLCYDGDERTQYETFFQSSACFDYWPLPCPDGECP